MSLNNFVLSKNKKFIYLGLAFFLVALGELAAVFMNIGIYFDSAITYAVGKAVVTTTAVKSIDLIYTLGFFFFRFFVMLGFYFIYYVTKKGRNRIEHFLILYFILIISIFTHYATFVFHLTVTFILLLVLVNYFEIYKENKSQNTKSLIGVFLVLFFSHFLMIFSFNYIIIVFANLLQLISYLLLLVIIIRIYQHGKKK